ncbi:hypothetical protein [Bowmanella dokdonensis]|uniref:Uncharacterized protein n=1 Tax=Bowmanella dokdonensis TaxID=751969 RepID=A0A939DPJ7_9ALTE|nr:hypothetical protein [Bowmanella dokdonensis]MBN7826415.1 hypothetical protein [Bowmanella dokdonensis]
MAEISLDELLGRLGFYQAKLPRVAISGRLNDPLHFGRIEARLRDECAQEFGSCRKFGGFDALLGPSSYFTALPVNFLTRSGSVGDKDREHDESLNDQWSEGLNSSPNIGGEHAKISDNLNDIGAGLPMLKEIADAAPLLWLDNGPTADRVQESPEISGDTEYSPTPASAGILPEAFPDPNSAPDLDWDEQGDGLLTPTVGNQGLTGGFAPAPLSPDSKVDGEMPEGPLVVTNPVLIDPPVFADSFPDDVYQLPPLDGFIPSERDDVAFPHPGIDLELPQQVLLQVDAPGGMLMSLGGLLLLTASRRCRSG